METWMKIVFALGLGMMLLFLLPRAKAMLQNSPKAERGDWQSVIIPLIAVIAFIFFLIQMVR